MRLAEAAELLIVEDNPSDLELTLRALKQCGATRRIAVVQDGAEALEYLFCTGRYLQRSPNQAPKVIFLDLKLPKIDGMEVLRQIKAHDRTRTIPVVVLSSSPQERDIQESYRMGANSYVVKPVEYPEFSEAIGQMGRYWLRLNQLSR